MFCAIIFSIHALLSHELSLGTVGSFNTTNYLSLYGKKPFGLGLLYESLFERSHKDPLLLTPKIALCYTLQGSVLTFFLRDGAHARDVKETFLYLQKHGLPLQKKYTKLIKKIETPSPSAITLFFKDPPSQDAIDTLALSPIFTNIQKLQGSGPYAIEKILGEHTIVYKRKCPSKDFYPFEKVRITYFRHHDLLFQAFLKKNIHFYFETDPLHWKMAYPQKPFLRKLERAHKRPVPVRVILINLRRFRDPRERQSLIASFDFKRLNAFFFDGQFKQPKSLFVNTKFETHSYVIPQNKGFIRKKLSLLIKDVRFEKIGLFLKQELLTKGVHLLVERVEPVIYEKRLRAKDFDLIIHSFDFALQAWTHPMVRAFHLRESFHSDSVHNFLGIKTLDSLIEKVEKSKTIKEIQKNLQIFDQTILTQHCWIPFMFDDKDRWAYWSDKITIPSFAPARDFDIIKESQLP